MKALILDCDGVIIDSEDLQRRAYNNAFQHFNVIGPWHDGPIQWTLDEFEALLATADEGKEQLVRYFEGEGWPTSTLQQDAPAGEDEQMLLVDTLHDWAAQHYQEIACSGAMEPRPGVLRLIDEAGRRGVKVAVCGSGSHAGVEAVLKCMLGETRFESLEAVLTGDDVAAPKPNPAIYEQIASMIRCEPAECVVIEDSVPGLEASLEAGMRCCITYTRGTKNENFGGAERIVKNVEENGTMIITVQELMDKRVVQDDRVSFAVTESTVIFQ